MNNNKIVKAVGVLYDMDNFVLSVMDNMYWLSMGVPDGEFDEADRHAAEINYADHDWLVAENDTFLVDDFTDLLEAFEEATESSRDYDQEERARIIAEARAILDMTESYDEEGNHEKCPECNSLLNDAGECPKCVHGEEDLDESLLMEGPLQDFINKRKNNVGGNIDKANKKVDKADAKLTKNLGGILKTGLTKDSLFYVDGKLLKYADFIKSKNIDSGAVNRALQAGVETLDPASEDAKQLASLIDAVVVNKDGYIVRRGLEVVKPGTAKFSKERLDLAQIKPDMTSAKVLTGNLKTDEPAAAAEPSPAADSSPAAGETSTSDAEETPAVASKPEWVTDKAVKAAITLRAKRKDGGADYYDKDGKTVDYKTITVDNMDEIYLDKDKKVSFMDLLNQTKENYAKRKKSIEQTAAIFGESYDDSMDYPDADEYGDYLVEDMTTEEQDELFQLAQEIGLKTTGDAQTFIDNERQPGESTLDALRRYRDDLGDDFYIYEESVELDKLEEDFTNADAILNRVRSAEIGDHVRDTLDRAARYFKTDLASLIIFEDKDIEYDPVYFADGSKELSRDLIKFDVASIEVLKMRLVGSYFLCFKTQEDADNYIAAAQTGNI